MISNETSILLNELFPISRSVTGPGIKKSNRIIEKFLGIKANFIEIKTGTKIFDWTIPSEWELINGVGWCLPSSKKLFDTLDTNLHVWSHSESASGIFTKSELIDNHLQFHPIIDEAVPYVTTYYSANWGISLSKKVVDNMCDGPFKIEINTTKKSGSLEIMEYLFPGKTNHEIFFSTYLCHPSMANNELTGPIVAAELIKKISKIKNRNYTYRIIFAPETIGALAYIKSRKIKNFNNVIHAFNLTCLANGNEWSIMPTRNGKTYTDYFAKLFMQKSKGNFIVHDFLNRGSDERQYNSPKVDLPMVSIMRTKYHDYDSYHTNLDNLNNLDLSLLQESIETYSDLIDILEEDCQIFTNTVGEPFLNKFKDTESLGGQNHNQINFRKSVLDFLAYSDGRTFIQILDRLAITFQEGSIIKNFLEKNCLISTHPVKRNLDV